MSKLLLPGLRIGYVAAAPEVIRLMANETVIIDRQGNDGIGCGGTNRVG
jgi:GntR family transcriptional regulator / MocR family aminotransferase